MATSAGVSVSGDKLRPQDTPFHVSTTWTISAHTLGSGNSYHSLTLCIQALKYKTHSEHLQGPLRGTYKRLIKIRNVQIKTVIMCLK